MKNLKQLKELLPTDYHEQLISKTKSAGTSKSAASLGMILLWLADDMQSSVDNELRKFGITENKLGMLIIVHLASELNTEVTPSVLAELVGVERASVTGILDWLEQRKFITRTLDPVDRRKLKIALNHKSKTLYQKILKTYWASCASLVSDLSAAEQAVLQKLTKRMLLSVKKKSIK